MLSTRASGRRVQRRRGSPDGSKAIRERACRNSRLSRITLYFVPAALVYACSPGRAGPRRTSRFSFECGRFIVARSGVATGRQETRRARMREEFCDMAANGAFPCCLDGVRVLDLTQFEAG